MDRLGAVSLAGVAIATLAAAAVQLGAGRTDAHRSHAALSAAVWAFASLALVAHALWSQWLLGVTPRDLGGAGFPVFVAPRSGAFVFRGNSARARFSPFFLLDGRSGGFTRFRPDRMRVPAFTPDGRMAVWVAPAIPWWWSFTELSGQLPKDIGDPWALRGVTLAVARFEGAAPAIEEQPLDLPEIVLEVLAVDDAGHRVVLLGRTSVFVWEVSEQKLVWSVPVSGVQ